MFKQEKRLPKAVYTSFAYRLAKGVLGHSMNNVFCQPFLTMRFSRFWSTWRAFHFVPHWIAFAFCALGALVPAPRQARKQGAAGKAKAT